MDAAVSPSDLVNEDRPVVPSGFARDHIDLVYAAALRQTGGRHHDAEDVTQQVFALAARHHDRLARHPRPLAWLHVVTRNVARNHRRAERRRLAATQRLSEQPGLLAPMVAEPVADWHRLAPFLDEALGTLGERDREAILLRFFARKSFAESATHLGLRENAARMRTERALQKLRRALARRGVRSTAAALALAMGHHATIAAPEAIVCQLSPLGLHVASALSLGAGPSLSLLMNTSTWLVPTLTFAAGITAGILLPLPQTVLSSPATPPPQILATPAGSLVASPPQRDATPAPASATSPQIPSSAPGVAVRGVASSGSWVTVLTRFRSIRFPTLDENLNPSPEAVELLGLDASETRAVTQIWRDTKAQLDRLASEKIVVEKQTAEEAVLIIPAVPEAARLREELRTHLRRLLGEDRATVFERNSDLTMDNAMLGFYEAPVRVVLSWKPDGRIRVHETIDGRYSMAMTYDELPKRFEFVILRTRRSTR